MKQKTPTAITQAKRTSDKPEPKQRKPRQAARVLDSKKFLDTNSVVSSDSNVDDAKKNAEVVVKGEDCLDDGNSSDLEKDFDSETLKDSVSSQGDSLTTEEENVDGLSQTVTTISKSRSNVANISSKKSVKSSNGQAKVTSKSCLDKELKDMNETVERLSKSSDLKEVDLTDEASSITKGVASDNETVEVEERGGNEDAGALDQRVEEMEARIGRLEQELREVAALEISLYSVVPEHGSSAHKVHTPARRLSRLYIYAGKHWTQGKRATIAKNTVSGLVLIAKSCSNDVPRLTFWLSNTIVLREIICQAFGSSRHSSPLARPSAGKLKGGTDNKQHNGSMQFSDDWQETGTFIVALEKVESWIFSRIVESVWWQSLTPHMQSPMRNSSSNKMGRLLGPALGDQQQGSFSINLWKNAFQDAFHRLCPVRAGGHECGCLPIIARMVMEQCIARLDIAMLNAILRESAHEIPTDPVSDPIVDSKVLPIPAGDLSFGSGAQLKNSVGNWSRWLTDLFGMIADDSPNEDRQSNEEDDRRDNELKSFNLLNELSDLLMLPKDMLTDRSIRKEVCPSIGLPLIKRILCNFTPDEFCLDPVPGAVLESLNAESIVERRISGETVRNFPYTASPVIYSPPSSVDIAEKVTESGTKSELSRNVSVVQRKGYTSDEELEELDSSLTSIVENFASSPTFVANESGNGKRNGNGSSKVVNLRYTLLREVWSA